MKTTTKIWLGLGVLVLCSPLGIFLPDHFKAGEAWGEGAPETLKNSVGYIPQGLQIISRWWNAPLPDYMFQGWANKGLSQLSLAYIFSALLGVVIVGTVVFILGKFLTRKENL